MSNGIVKKDGNNQIQTLGKPSALERQQQMTISDIIKMGIQKEIAEAIASHDVFLFSAKMKGARKHMIDNMANNLQLFREYNITIDDLRDVGDLGLILLLWSTHLDIVLQITQKLGIKKLLNIHLIQKVLEEIIGYDNVFDITRLHECVEHFGANYLYTVFSYNDGLVGMIGEASMSNKNKRDLRDLGYTYTEQQRAILMYCCSIKGNKDIFPSTYITIEQYFTPVSQLYPYIDTKPLGIFSYHIKALSHITGIPSEILQTIPAEDLVRHCNTIYSLAAVRVEKQPKRPRTYRVLEDCSFDALYTKESFSWYLNRLRKIYIDSSLVEQMRSFIEYIEIHTSYKLPENDKDFLRKKSDRIYPYMHERQNTYEKEEKRKKTPVRNFAIIKSLAENTLSTSQSLHYLLGEGKQQSGKNSSMSFTRQYHQIVNRLEEKYKGLYSIGGKIHFPESIPLENIEKFKEQYNFTGTPFRLIHANTSLILPPTNYPEELMFMIARMGESGLFLDNPQLQISIPGRLPNELGAILGSAMLLLSNEHVKYTKESFGTAHHDNKTGRRMVAYDDGVYDPAFSWNSHHIAGRTDVLLLKDINLIPKAKIIGSLLSQTIYDGLFAELGEQFIRDYQDLLTKYNMDHVLDGHWIYKSDVDMDETLDNHYNMVKSLTEKHAMDSLIYQHTKQETGLMIFELRKLLNTYRERIQSIQRGFN